MPCIRLVILALLLFPAISLAAASAGLPERSVWLSDATPTDGEKVTIYTALFNSTGSTVTNTLTFLIDGKPLSSVAMTLKPGTSQIGAADWIADSGEHAFSAQFGEGAGKQATAQVTIAIAKAPPPSPLVQGAVGAVNLVSSLASSSAPIVSSIASTVLAQTESFREKGLAFAEAHMESTASPDPSAKSSGKLPSESGTAAIPTTLQNKVVAKETKSADGVTGFEAEGPSLGNRIAQLAAPVIAFSFGSKAVFYPLFLFLILAILYTLGRWATRPRF